MKTCNIAVVMLALLAGTAMLQGQAMPEMPEMPAPQKEHQWLQRFVGEWETEAVVMMTPDQPAERVKGTESVRQIGGFWIAAEGHSEMMGQPFTYLLQLGYDPEKQKYVSTWIDSMTSLLLVSQGTLDAGGNVLTLEAEGPCPMVPGTTAQFRDVVEFKSDDHRTFTSSMKMEGGEWTTMVTGEVRRKQ